MNAEDRVGAGDRAEFDEVFCELLPRLYRRVLAVTASPHAAEDALHDAYLKLAARPERVLSHPNPYAYALATVINVIRDSWRGRQREMLVADVKDLPPRLWDGGVEMRDAQLETLRLLAHLTPRQAGVILLVDVDGFTVDEAARALGLHRGTIALTRARALRKLRTLLSQETIESAEVRGEHA